MEWRTLSSRLTSREGSSKVMLSGGSEMRYVCKGLVTPGHTPSAQTDRRRDRGQATRRQTDGPRGPRPRGELTMPQLVVFLGVAGRGFGGSSLRTASLPAHYVLTAILILPHGLIPEQRASQFTSHKHTCVQTHGRQAIFPQRMQNRICRSPRDIRILRWYLYKSVPAMVKCSNDELIL